MGAVEEGGKVATNIVAALSGQPIVLALVVFNCLLMGGVIYGTRENRMSFERTLSKLIDDQHELSKLLYQCTPSGNKTGLHWDLLSNPFIKR